MYTDSQRKTPRSHRFTAPLINPHNIVTRRYPWGIQRLVSTHQFPHNPRDVQTCIFWGVVGVGVGCVGLDQLNPKYQDLSKSAFFGEGVGEGGGSWSRPTFLKYLSRGTQGILSTNFAIPYSGSPCIADMSLTHYVCED